jgi:cysteine desulfuration protein SufE
MVLTAMTTLDDFVDNFTLLDDWEQRYQYLIELGEHLPLMPAKLKTDDNKVKGCMSQVWVSAYMNRDGHIMFYGDSDTAIIKGVVALLVELMNNQSVDAIQQVDMDEIFVRLQLDEHLSPNRHVGVYAILTLMQQQAKRLKQAA